MLLVHAERVVAKDVALGAPLGLRAVEVAGDRSPGVGLRATARAKFPPLGLEQEGVRRPFEAVLMVQACGECCRPSRG